MMNIGGVLRRLRGKVTQAELEERTGIKRTYLSKIENERLNNPTVGTLKCILDALGIPLSKFFREVEKDGRNSL